MDDLSKLIGSQRKVFGALASRENQLKELVTNFNTTVGALAAEESNLSETVAELPQVLEAANPALDNLNAAFPPTRAFALEIIPGVRETPATIEAGFPWVRQTRALLSQPELQGLVDELRPAVSDFAAFVDGQIDLLPQLNLFNRCQLEVVLPTQEQRIEDGNLSTGLRNYEEFFQTLVSLAGESQNFDGNGSYVRFQAGGGGYQIQTPTVGASPLFANATEPPLGSSPGQGTEAPLQAELRLSSQRGPGSERRQDRGRPMMRQIKKQAPVFISIVVLFALALGVGGYILSNQRFYLPAWFPVLGTDFYEVNAELQTAQAVVPGQGQTVNIAGVKVGEVGEVTLEDGHAVVQMQIKDQYKPIYKDATILLRPKTGLKDMYLSLDPGTESAGEIEEGGSVPVSNTLPDVNADEILAQLDADTRAYLRVLLNAGGLAFDDEAVGADERYEQTAAQDLRETFKRFEPTARYGNKLTRLLARRRGNIRRVIHNFQEFSTALAGRDRQLASLVDSANANFEAFASEETALREALQLFPEALDQTETTLRSTSALAAELGPALQRLRPFARNLGPALEKTQPFFRETTPIIRDQIRPFARDVQPTVRDLRSASKNLAVVTPRLTSSFKVLNRFFNTLAYNPPGSAESFLFWSAWSAHSGATLYTLQDAHGPIRRGVILVSCAAYQTLEAVISGNPQLGLSTRLLNLPDEKVVCPNNVPPDDNIP